MMQKVKKRKKTFPSESIDSEKVTEKRIAPSSISSTSSVHVGDLEEYISDIRRAGDEYKELIDSRDAELIKLANSWTRGMQGMAQQRTDIDVLKREIEDLRFQLDINRETMESIIHEKTSRLYMNFYGGEGSLDLLSIKRIIKDIKTWLEDYRKKREELLQIRSQIEYLNFIHTQLDQEIGKFGTHDEIDSFLETESILDSTQSKAKAVSESIMVKMNSQREKKREMERLHDEIEQINKLIARVTTKLEAIMSFSFSIEGLSEVDQYRTRMLKIVESMQSISIDDSFTHIHDYLTKTEEYLSVASGEKARERETTGFMDAEGEEGEETRHKEKLLTEEKAESEAHLNLMIQLKAGYAQDHQEIAASGNIYGAARNLLYLRTLEHSTSKSLVDEKTRIVLEERKKNQKDLISARRTEGYEKSAASYDKREFLEDFGDLDDWSNEINDSIQCIHENYLITDLYSHQKLRALVADKKRLSKIKVVELGLDLSGYLEVRAEDPAGWTQEMKSVLSSLLSQCSTLVLTHSSHLDMIRRFCGFKCSHKKFSEVPLSGTLDSCPKFPNLRTVVLYGIDHYKKYPTKTAPALLHCLYCLSVCAESPLAVYFSNCNLFMALDHGITEPFGSRKTPIVPFFPSAKKIVALPPLLR
ncbi:hypothetical protein ADUPG1_013102, partial [Aduncisulcus paluster]